MGLAALFSAADASKSLHIGVEGSTDSQVSTSVDSIEAPELWFMYLGRKGSLGRFCIELAEAAGSQSEYKTTYVVSTNNIVLGNSFSKVSRVIHVRTFDRAALLPALAGLWFTFKQLRREIKKSKPTAVISLMPHLYSPLISKFFRLHGVKYISIIHDALKHPGDPTGVLTPWLRSEARNASLVITLSQAVADQLAALRATGRNKTLRLFHPDLLYQGRPSVRRRDFSRPFRILYFGRVMKYKGLGLLTDAVEILRKSGYAIDLGVVGAGTIANTAQLRKLHAHVINRWIDDDEVSDILQHYDAVCLSHVEASQSGVAAMAFGSYLPVIANPVGGLIEQVIEGKTGVLSTQPTARSFAAAIQRLASDEQLYNHISQYLYDSREQRSMVRFFDELTAELCPTETWIRRKAS